MYLELEIELDFHELEKLPLVTEQNQCRVMTSLGTWIEMDLEWKWKWKFFPWTWMDLEFSKAQTPASTMNTKIYYFYFKTKGTSMTFGPLFKNIENLNLI